MKKSQAFGVPDELATALRTEIEWRSSRARPPHGAAATAQTGAHRPNVIHHQTACTAAAWRGSCRPQVALHVAVLAAATLSQMPAAFAGTSTFTGQYSLGAGVNTVDGGAGNLVIEKQITIGPTWDTSGSFGGTVTGVFGDTYGLQVNAVSSGKVQLDLGYHSTSGLFTAQTPLSLRLTLPDVIRPGETFSVLSDLAFSLPSTDPFTPRQTLSFQSTSSDLGFRAGIALETDTRISGQACLVSCDNFNLELASFAVRQELLSFNYDASAPSAIDSFDQEIILLRGNALEVSITDRVRNAAVNSAIPLIKGPTGDALSLSYGNTSQTTLFPVALAQGSYTDGAASVGGSARADVLRLNANLGQIATAVSGGTIPPLEGDLKALIANQLGGTARYEALPGVVKDTLDQVEVNLLRAEVGLALGFEQSFELDVPDVMLDLTLRQTGQTFSFLAGSEGHLTLPAFLTESIDLTNLTFDINARFLPTLVQAETDLTLTPQFTLTGPRLDLGLVKSPLISQTWELPSAAVNVAENQFLVQFEGSLLGPNLSLGSIIDRSRVLTNLTANNGVLDLSGTYTNTIVRPDQTVSEVRTADDVSLVNSIVGDGAAPVLQVDHRLELRAGSQLGTDEIRIGGSGELAVTQGQIARDGASVPGGNARMDIYLGGTIQVNAITDGVDGFGNPLAQLGGKLLIDAANVLPDFDGAGQGLIEVRGPAGLGTGANTLRLSNIGTFQSALDVGDHGQVFIDPALDTPTRFTGERVFELAGTHGASVRNLNVINIASGPVSIESGLLQTQDNPADTGFLSVKSTLELRSNLSGGFVGLLPGALLKLYDNGALDSGVRVEGSQARIVVLGDSLISGRVVLNGGSLLPALTTDHASFNESGQAGVSQTPHLQLDAASLLIRQGSLFNASGAQISALPQTSIVLEVGPNSVTTGYGTVYGPVGSIENHGSFEFTGANAVTRHQTNATNVLPAFVNAEGATLAVNAGQTRISGGVLNSGEVSIGAAPGENAELRLGNLAGGSNGAANHDFVQFAGTTVVHDTGSLVMQPEASLIINGGRVDFFGARLEGRIINNGGILNIDTANPQNPLQATLLGDFTQMAGELILGEHQLISGFHIAGTATLGGILDLTAFQSGIDGLVGGYDFTRQHGEQFEALSFGASLSRFGAYRLPEVDTFYWVPVYSDTALAFRLQDPLLTPVNITSIVQGFQSQIGVVPNVPQTVNAANAQLELAAQLQIGNAFSGAGILNIDDAVLNTNDQGIAIERTGQLNATGNSVIAAFGNLSVNGGSLQLLQNSRIAPSANGIALVAMNGADIRHEGGGYELPADGSLRVESGASVFINGSLDFANDRGALLRVTGPGSTLTAAPNGEMSEWFVPTSQQADFRGEVEISNGGVLNIGSLAATAISDEFTIAVSGAGSRLQQTPDASLDLGRSTNRRGDVFGGVTMTVANGGEVLTGSGGIDIGYLGVLNLLGGFFSANSDVEVVGGQINGSALALDLNGHDLTASDKATLNFNTALELSRGSTLELIADARLNALSIDINSAATSGGGSLVASGGLTFIETDPGLVSHWGNGANTAQVSLLDGVTANFGSIEMDGTGTSLRIGSSIATASGFRRLSQVTMENLAVGTSGFDGSVFVGLNDGASVDVNAAVTLGGIGQGTAVLEIDGGNLRTQVVDINRSGLLFQQAGSLLIQSLLSVDGAFTHADGAVNGEAANLILGTDSSSAGVYSLGGDRAMLSMSNEYIGDHGLGTFTHDNGMNSVSSFLVVGANSGSNGTYLFNGGTLLAGNAFIGDRGTGTFTHRSGLNSLVSNLVLGANAGSDGIYTLSELGQVFASNQFIGDRGTGAFAQSGGINSMSGFLVVGAHAGSTGSYILSGGPATALNAGDEFIGDNGTGTFTHSGGVNTVASNLVLGANAGSHGTYILSGSGIVRATNQIIGGNGIGAFIQTAGGNAVSDTLYLGGSNGSYGLSGTGSLSAREVVIGAHGFGRFDQHGGDHQIESNLYVGGSDGRYTLGGGTLSVGNIVRLPGASTFDLVGGQLNVTGALIDVESFNIGSGTNSGGQFTLRSGQLLMADALAVSSAGSELIAGSLANLDGGVITTGALAVMNGGRVTSRGAWVGSNVASANSVNVITSAHVSGADSLWQSRFLNIGFVGDGSVEVADGGAVTTTNNLILGGTDGQSGELGIAAGGRVETGVNAYVGRASAAIGNVVLQGAGATWDIGDSLYLGGDNLVAGGTASLRIGVGAVVNVGNKIKFWDGGSLFIEGGMLNAATIDAGVNGLTLTGGVFAVDTFNGNLVNQGATLAPGNSPGITEVIGNYSQDVNSTLHIEIGGLLAGSGGYDALHVTGSAALGGTLAVDLYDFGSGSFSPRAGDFFDIVGADTISGEFDFFTLALIEPGLVWRLDYLVDAFGSTDVLRLSVAPVPLPPAVWLMGCALLGMLARVRRQAWAQV